MAIPDPNAAARFYGLSEGQVSSFTSSPDGSVVSLLFDDFCAPPTVPSKVAPVPVRTFTLVCSDAAAGQMISFDLRGGMENAPGASISVKVADQLFELEPKDENFLVQARAPAGRDGNNTRVEVSLELPTPAADDAAGQLLTIDSIDVSIGERSA